MDPLQALALEENERRKNPPPPPDQESLQQAAERRQKMMDDYVALRSSVPSSTKKSSAQKSAKARPAKVTKRARKSKPKSVNANQPEYSILTANDFAPANSPVESAPTTSTASSPATYDSINQSSTAMPSAYPLAYPPPSSLVDTVWAPSNTNWTHFPPSTSAQPAPEPWVTASTMPIWQVNPSFATMDNQPKQAKAVEKYFTGPKYSRAGRKKKPATPKRSSPSVSKGSPAAPSPSSSAAADAPPPPSDFPFSPGEVDFADMDNSMFLEGKF